MRKLKVLFLISLIAHSPVSAYSQTDSTGFSNKSSFGLYFSSGFGIGTRGGAWGLSTTFVSSSGWGLSVCYRLNILKSKDTPSDYFDDGRRVFAPRNYLEISSVNLVKEFPMPNKKMRFGIEAGPSRVRYNIAEFELNSSYDPNNPWFGTAYKYLKTHSATTAVGLNLRAKLEFIPVRFYAFEIAVFSNINSIAPVTGLEFFVSLGKIPIRVLDK
jgi:hypothetical protein